MTYDELVAGAVAAARTEDGFDLTRAVDWPDQFRREFPDGDVEKFGRDVLAGLGMETS